MYLKTEGRNINRVLLHGSQAVLRTLTRAKIPLRYRGSQFTCDAQGIDENGELGGSPCQRAWQGCTELPAVDAAKWLVGLTSGCPIHEIVILARWLLVRSPLYGKSGTPPPDSNLRR